MRAQAIRYVYLAPTYPVATGACMLCDADAYTFYREPDGSEVTVCRACFDEYRAATARS